MIDVAFNMRPVSVMATRINGALAAVDETNAPLLVTSSACRTTVLIMMTIVPNGSSGTVWESGYLASSPDSSRITLIW